MCGEVNQVGDRLTFESLDADDAQGLIDRGLRPFRVPIAIETGFHGRDAPPCWLGGPIGGADQFDQLGFEGAHVPFDCAR